MVENICSGVLICPFCTEPLQLVGRTLQCSQRHTFDLARQGYVNLLGGGRKKSLGGDTREMLQDRRAFFAQGHYQPLTNLLCDLAVAQVARSPGAQKRPDVVVEIGSGTGYYLGALRAAFSVRWPERPFCCLGIDVAREAARLAAGRYKAVRFVVADAWQQIPVATDSVGLLLNIFAPRNGAEFARILRAGGRLLVVLPGPDHLADLPAALRPLQIEPDKAGQVINQLAAFFRLKKRRSLTFQMALPPTDLVHLVGMTPHARHLPTDWPHTLVGADAYTVTADFILLLFERLTE